MGLKKQQISVGFALAAGLLATVSSCGPARKQSHVPAPATERLKPINTNNRFPELPTKPDGGVDIRRRAPLSPEENLARVRKNIDKPLVFGVGAGGITLQTTFNESLDILSDPYGSSGDMLFYRESMRVVWETKAPELPKFIVVDEGYLGALDLPEKYGKVIMGDSLADHFGDTGEGVLPGTQMINEIARHAMKKGADYDCVKAEDCDIDADGEHIILSFPVGAIYVTNNAEKKLSIALIAPAPPPPSPPLTADVVFGKEAGGISITMQRADVVKLLGEPIGQSSSGALLYDNQNLVVKYEDDSDDVAFLQVQKKYAGTVKMPPSVGDQKIGDSLKKHFSESDPKGENLLRELARFAEGKDKNYDCLSEKTCEMAEQDDLILMGFKGALVVIGKDEEKPLLIVQISGE